MHFKRGSFDKREYWVVVKIPLAVKLIRSCYVNKLKKDWTDKVVTWKLQLVILGFNQVKGVDYGETFAPSDEATTLRLILVLA